MLSDIKDLLLSDGVSDVSFCRVDDGPQGLLTAVSIAVELSPAVVAEITDAPTHTYFHHYRTVNAFIDRELLKAGLMLSREGYRYIPVAASQSINNGVDGFSGRYSHKKAAVLSGMGTIGKNDLFIHYKYGVAVRLGTLFTDAPLSSYEAVPPIDLCKGCRICVDRCPAGAIRGESFAAGSRELIDAKKCSDYMKKQFQLIGRGAVCGICMSSCPHFKGRENRG